MADPIFPSNSVLRLDQPMGKSKCNASPEIRVSCGNFIKFCRRNMRGSDGVDGNNRRRAPLERLQQSDFAYMHIGITSCDFPLALANRNRSSKYKKEVAASIAFREQYCVRRELLQQGDRGYFFGNFGIAINQKLPTQAIQ